MSVLELPEILKFKGLYHSHASYGGPWIENVFADYAQQIEMPNGWTYIPIPWTDIFCYFDFGPGAWRQQFRERAQILASIRKVLNHLNPKERYFTVCQHDDGIGYAGRFGHATSKFKAYLESNHVPESISIRLPKNVFVFSSGGVGDLPIPLLKEPRLLTLRPKTIPCSFMGTIAGPVRERMAESLKDYCLFGKGDTWYDVMTESVFSLCPRGSGRTSFRLYEALSAVSLPVYIWDDIEWLPYRDEIDWNRDIGISIGVNQLDRLPRLIEAHTPEMILHKQQMIQKLYDDHFTYRGTCKQIIRYLIKMNQQVR